MTQRAYTVHQKNCEGVKLRVLGLKRRHEEFMEKQDRLAEERERAARQVVSMLSDPTIEVRRVSSC